MRGGPAYNLLQMVENRVYFCVCLAKNTFYGKKKEEMHCFVYNSNYKDYETCPWVTGCIIDNRPRNPIRLIEEEDRISPKASRRVFDDFFRCSCMIKTVFLVERA